MRGLVTALIIRDHHREGRGLARQNIEELAKPARMLEAHRRRKNKTSLRTAETQVHRALANRISASLGLGSSVARE